jgi:hypothetical protein
VSMYSILIGALKWLLGIFRKALMPNKKDFLGGLVISAAVYLLFGISVIILLPLIIVGVFVTYVLRRAWKAFMIYWTLRTIRKKTTKEVDKLKNLFK